MTFTPPALLCESTLATWMPELPCVLLLDHDGLHRNGLLTWHDPVRILVGGREPDLTVDTDHWLGGAVILTDQSEPDL